MTSLPQSLPEPLADTLPYAISIPLRRRAGGITVDLLSTASAKPKLIRQKRSAEPLDRQWSKFAHHGKAVSTRKIGAVGVPMRVQRKRIIAHIS